MEVERKDVFDFVVVLTEAEFKLLLDISNRGDMSIEEAIEGCLVRGFSRIYDILSEKE